MLKLQFLRYFAQIKQFLWVFMALVFLQILFEALQCILSNSHFYLTFLLLYLTWLYLWLRFNYTLFFLGDRFAWRRLLYLLLYRLCFFWLRIYISLSSLISWFLSYSLYWFFLGLYFIFISRNLLLCFGWIWLVGLLSWF